MRVDVLCLQAIDVEKITYKHTAFAKNLQN